MKKETVIGWSCIGLAAIALALGCSSLETGFQAPVPAVKVDSQGLAIEWGYSTKDASMIARATERPIMLDFFATWCAPCKMMDDYTYSTPDVIRATRAVVPVRIDMDQKPEVARKYHVRTIPTTIFLTSDGKIISRMVGVLPPDGMLQRIEEAITAESESK
jgi:thiol:disulfide interchange protein DsbD